MKAGVPDPNVLCLKGSIKRSMPQFLACKVLLPIKFVASTRQSSSFSTFLFLTKRLTIMSAAVVRQTLSEVKGLTQRPLVFCSDPATWAFMEPAHLQIFVSASLGPVSDGVNKTPFHRIWQHTYGDKVCVLQDHHMSRYRADT